MSGRTKLKEFLGVPIYVTDEGKFEARVGKVDLSRQKLRDLELEIAKTHKGIRAMETSKYNSIPVREVSVLGIKDGKWRLSDNTLIYAELYRFDQADFDRLVFIDLRREEEEIRHRKVMTDLLKEQTDIAKRLQRLDESDLQTLRRSQEEGA